MLFIDAVNEVTRERSVSYLKPEHQERITAAYRSFTDEPGFTHTATLHDIAAQDYSLSIPLYVRGRGVCEAQEANAANGLREAIRTWEQNSKSITAEYRSITENSR